MARSAAGSSSTTSTTGRWRAPVGFIPSSLMRSGPSPGRLDVDASQRSPRARRRRWRGRARRRSRRRPVRSRVGLAEVAGPASLPDRRPAPGRRGAAWRGPGAGHVAGPWQLCFDDRWTHDSGGGNGVNTLRSERGTPSFSTVAYDPAGHIRGRKLVAPAQYRRGALANGGYFQTRLGPYGVWASPVRPGQLGFSVADRYHLLGDALKSR